MVRFRHLSLAQQLSLMTLCVVVVVFTAMTLFVEQRVSRGFLAAVETQLGREVALVAQEMELQYASLNAHTEDLSRVFFSMYEGAFTLDRGRSVRVGGHEAQLLLHAGAPVALDHGPPDRFTRLTGGAATVFVRAGDDFLRIATSLTREDGSRAVGTLLGRGHPAHARLMAGDTYSGTARLFGRDFMTRYLPLKSGGQVIGALYVGFDYSADLAAFRAKLAALRFGATGYAYAVSARAGEEGMVVLHPALEGNNLFQLADASGARPFAALARTERGILHYPWQERSDAPPRDKLVAFQRVGGWDWIVVGGSYTEEFLEVARALRNQLLLLSLLGGAVLLASLVWLLRRVLHPLRQVGSAMAAIGEGDLRSSMQLRDDDGAPTRNEILILARLAAQTAARLRELVSDMVEAAGALTDTAMRAAQVTQQTKRGVTDQESHTAEVATAVTQMASTVEEVARHATLTADETRLSERRSADGRGAVEEVVAAIEQLAEEVEGAAQLFDRLHADAGSISGVMAVINGVAEQTNLLALNAAIEAARAGEQGRGFAVVADEVRTLANKTRDSTAEIQGAITRLQASTDAALAAMRNGRNHASDSVRIARAAGTVLVEISQSATRISEMMTRIASAAAQETAAADQMNRRIGAIRDVAHETALGSEELAAAAGRLQELAQRLTAATARFRL